MWMNMTVTAADSDSTDNVDVVEIQDVEMSHLKKEKMNLF